MLLVEQMGKPHSDSDEREEGLHLVEGLAHLQEVVVSQNRRGTRVGPAFARPVVVKAQKKRVEVGDPCFHGSLTPLPRLRVLLPKLLLRLR